MAGVEPERGRRRKGKIASTSSRNDKQQMNVGIFVPLLPAMPYADEVFYSFIAIAQQGYGWFKQPFGRIDMVRSRAAEALVKSETYTHICMLDADHLHPPDIVARLARWADADPGKKIIAGLNFRRTPPFDPLLYIQEGEDFWQITEWAGEGLLEVDRVGTCAILIAKEVFQALEQPYFYAGYEHVAETGVWESEDMGFCKKAREAGFKIYVDVTATSPHLSAMAVGVDEYRRYREKHGQEDQV